MIGVFQLIGEVSHEWQRRMTLRGFHSGAVRRDDICDADFLLKAAGKHHGSAAQRPCPVCTAEMREVLWIYGENLGRRSGTARSAEEIDSIVSDVGPVTVHRVEVCQRCGWNHLLSVAEAIAISEEI